MIYTKTLTIPSFAEYSEPKPHRWLYGPLVPSSFFWPDLSLSTAHRLLPRMGRKREERAVVNKTGFIVPFCLFFVTGCVMSDNSETDLDKPAVTTPGASSEDVSASPPVIAESATAPKTVRPLNRDEIRELQIRLKEMGFDPGPADGVPGARTRAALVRLQTSCAAWKSTRNSSAEEQAGVLEHKLPVAKKDIQVSQARLRSAGFDSGPIDGILGARTKTVLMAVQDTCPKVNDFADNLLSPVSVSLNQKSAPLSYAGDSSNQQSTRPPTGIGAIGIGAIKQISAPVTAQSQEEIRILQLRLRDAGFDPGPFDGVMGPKTRSALQQYEATQRGKKTKISLTTGDAMRQY